MLTSVVRIVPLSLALFLLSPLTAFAQPSLADAGSSAAAQAASAGDRRQSRGLRIGAEGGVGVDPELIMVGAHAAIGPVFRDNIEFRPGVELGLGEVTTLLSINLDVFYAFPGMRQNRWAPYAGIGPAIGLSHRGFNSGTDTSHVTVTTTTTGSGTTTGTAGGSSSTTATTEQNRFNFSDTDFNGGMNFIVGARSPRGVFFEMRATAWGVSNIRLMAGFNF